MGLVQCGSQWSMKVDDLHLFGFHTAAVYHDFKHSLGNIRPVTGSSEQFDFALCVEPFDDLRLVICVVDACLSEGAGVSVVFPIVVPVAVFVCSISKHGHLERLNITVAIFKNF